MIHLKRPAVHVVVVLALLLCLLPSFGRSQAKGLSTDELSKQSEIVAVGTVTTTQSGWENNKARIVTYVTLNVSEYLKGGGGNTVTVITPGGEVDGVGELYTHTARFAKDEEVVVFAQKDRKGRYTVSGGNQGKFAVTKEERTGRSVVGGHKSLDDFRAEVKKAAAAPKN